MYRIFFIFILFISALSSSMSAQDLSKNVINGGAENNTIQLKSYNCTDPELDLQQFDEKTGKAIVTKYGLELESKKDNIYCMSFCELPIDTKNDDFIVQLIMLPAKISDDKPFGIVFDVESESDYRMLLIFKKSFQLINVKDDKQSIVKKGVYKMPGGKGILKSLIPVTMMRIKGKLLFYLGDLEILKMNSPEFKSSNFGFIVGPKTKMTGIAIGYKSDTAELEEEN